METLDKSGKGSPPTAQVMGVWGASRVCPLDVKLMSRQLMIRLTEDESPRLRPWFQHSSPGRRWGGAAGGSWAPDTFTEGSAPCCTPCSRTGRRWGLCQIRAAWSRGHTCFQMNWSCWRQGLWTLPPPQLSCVCVSSDTRVWD